LIHRWPSQTISALWNRAGASYRKKILKSFKGHPKKFYGYMRKLKTVKEKVGQIKKVNGEYTASDMETAQALGEYFSVFIKEGEYIQSQDDQPVVHSCITNTAAQKSRL